jgi:predicted O-methyltransferase YrrM
VFDIGTHNGRSAVAMAGSATNVVTIDNYISDHTLPPVLFENAAGFIRDSELGDRITMLKGDWREILQHPEDLLAFDAIFYDASHMPPYAYEKDFLALCDDYPGLIMLHDYKHNDPGMSYVVEAVDEFTNRTKRKRELPLPRTSVVWFPAVV